jgi:hypothetical protein
VAPRTAIEETVATIGGPCQRDDLGVDDFFGLGGHSLLAARDRADRQQPHRISAARSSRLRPSPAWRRSSDAAALSTRRRWRRFRASPATAMPLSRGQERLWFVQRMAPERPLTCRWPCACRRAERSALERALAAVVSRHEVLRMAFPSRDGRPVAVMGHAPSPWSTTTSRACRTRTARRGRDHRPRRHATFDVENGPLGRHSWCGWPTTITCWS